MSKVNKKKVKDNNTRLRGFNLKKFYFPLIIIFGSFMLSLLINESGVEIAMDFPIDISKELEGSLDGSIDWIILTFGGFFDVISDFIKIILGKLIDLLLWIPWPIIMTLVFIIGWKVASVKIASMSVLGLVVLGSVNLWEPTMVTVAIMVIAVLISISIGIPIGILAARNDLIDARIRTV